MSIEILYTSAPKGLKQGSRGFCTVVSTAGMPINLASRLEALSGYRQMYAADSPDAGKNPVTFSHLRFTISGQRKSVVSRVAAYGNDYSGRTNKLAHHVVLEPHELAQAGPAWLLQQPHLMQTSWDGTCATPATGPVIPQSDQPARVCSMWKSVTGDAAWGGAVANALIQSSGKPCWIIYSIEQRDQLLPLLNEAIAILPIERRWDATFSTYATQLPPDVECSVRCVVEGSEEARMAAARGTVIRLQPAPYAGAVDELAILARGQKPPSTTSRPTVRQTVSQSSAVITNEEVVDQFFNAPEPSLVGSQQSPPPIPQGPPPRRNFKRVEEEKGSRWLLPIATASVFGIAGLAYLFFQAMSVSAPTSLATTASQGGTPTQTKPVNSEDPQEDPALEAPKEADDRARERDAGKNAAASVKVGSNDARIADSEVGDADDNGAAEKDANSKDSSANEAEVEGDGTAGNNSETKDVDSGKEGASDPENRGSKGDNHGGNNREGRIKEAASTAGESAKESESEGNPENMPEVTVKGVTSKPALSVRVTLLQLLTSEMTLVAVRDVPDVVTERKYGIALTKLPEGSVPQGHLNMVTSKPNWYASIQPKSESGSRTYGVEVPGDHFDCKFVLVPESKKIYVAVNPRDGFLTRESSGTSIAGDISKLKEAYKQLLATHRQLSKFDRPDNTRASVPSEKWFRTVEASFRANGYEEEFEQLRKLGDSYRDIIRTDQKQVSIKAIDATRLKVEEAFHFLEEYKNIVERKQASDKRNLSYQTEIHEKYAVAVAVAINENLQPVSDSISRVERIAKRMVNVPYRDSTGWTIRVYQKPLTGNHEDLISEFPVDLAVTVADKAK
ncbi:hypothetical protein [Crateriforma conspicua]|uniref:Uncharacterized protein n=1 Tax=Crateriforma conspicua TaxID=2527996 RepID=A0A5C6FSS2_9PLAN|nr:hypothetical protein [Crateriforma conspicua]TWU65939.1 hypothetical protein V7x_14930 [Crateriforma conspicua]